VEIFHGLVNSIPLLFEIWCCRWLLPDFEDQFLDGLEVNGVFRFGRISGDLIKKARHLGVKVEGVENWGEGYWKGGALCGEVLIGEFQIRLGLKHQTEVVLTHLRFYILNLMNESLKISLQRNSLVMWDLACLALHWWNLIFGLMIPVSLFYELDENITFLCLHRKWLAL
jgi:hypothetical protein